MAVKAGTAFVDFEGDFSALNKQVSSHFSSLAKKAAPAGKKIGHSLGAGMATGISSASKVAAVGVGAVTAEVIKATKGWSQHQAIVRRSAATIKSTGGAARVTAKHVENLSDKIEKQTGLDGDLVQSGANLLLTFTNIRNGVGKNNKVFDQATGTIANMSKALGQDTKSSAVQLGKALNDPVKGISALSRVGVSFTTQQKEQIKSFAGMGNAIDNLKIAGVGLDAKQKNQIKTLGDLADPLEAARDLNLKLTDAQKKQLGAMQDGTGAMKAQKIILNELGKEFPKVKATPFERLATVGRQLEDTIGKQVLPIFNRFVREVVPKLQHVADAASDIFDNKHLNFGEKIKALGEVVKREFGPFADKMVQALKDAHLDDKLAAVIAWATPKVAAAFKTMAPTVVNAFINGFLAAPAWAKFIATGWLLKKFGGFSAFQSIGNTAGGSMASGVSTGFSGKAAGFMKAAGKTALTAAVITGLTEGFAVAREDLGFTQSVSTWLSRMSLGAVGTDFTKKFATVQQQIAEGMKPPKLDKGLWSVNPFENLTPTNWEHYINHEGFNAGQRRVLLDMKALRDRAVGVRDELARRGIVVDIKTLNTKEAVDALQRVKDAIERLASGGSQDIRSLRTNVRLNMRAIKNTLGADSAAGKEAISANFSAAIGNIQRSMKTGTISVKDGTALIQTYMVRSLMNFGFSREQALNVAKDPSRKTSYTGGPEEGTRGPGHQRGGYINMGAPTGDSVHAMLERDEYVLNRKAVKRIGKTALDRVNFGSAPRFQKGGSVTGDTDVLPALLNALRAMSGRTGVPIYIQSGRRTLGEQAALVGSKGLYGPGNPTGAAAASPNAPHVRGVAADITPGRAQFGSVASQYGLGFTVPTEAWHIQLLDAAAAAGAKAVNAVAQTVAGVKLLGPDSALKSLSQSAIDATQGAAQGVVNKVFSSLAPTGGGGEGAPSGGAAGSLGKAQLKSLWTRAGGPPGVANVAAAIALAESGGIPSRNNADRPGDGGRHIAAGLWQILGLPFEGNVYDPMTNARMAVSKYNSAGGFSPWEAYTKGSYSQYLQQGGSAGQRTTRRLTRLIRRGALPSGSAINKVVTQIAKTSKHGKLAGAGKTLRTRLIDRIKGLDLPKSVRDLAGSESKVTRFDDLQEHAGMLTDSGAIQTALEAQQKSLGRDLTAAEQDKIIGGKLGRVQGHTQIEWLAQELGALGSWRNALIRAHIKLTDRLQQFKAALDAARKRREKLHDAIVKAKAKRAKLVSKRKGTKGAARKSIDNQIKNVDNDLRVLTLEYDTLNGDSGVIAKLTGKRDAFSTALTDANTNLHEVQGSVAPGDTYRTFGNLQGLNIGRLLGTIFTVRNALATSGISSYRIPPSDVATPDVTEPDTPTVPDDPSREMLTQLLREANIRTAVSQAQFDVFKNLPFGGSFKDGGTVPGPYGAPRMILAHGGEVVIPNDASNAPSVSLHFANGMEWLKQFVDVRVDNQTRAQGRRSERQLPGRAGTLR